jgi:hypothetical protein
MDRTPMGKLLYQKLISFRRQLNSYVHAVQYLQNYRQSNKKVEEQICSYVPNLACRETKGKIRKQNRATKNGVTARKDGREQTVTQKWSDHEQSPIETSTR